MALHRTGRVGGRGGGGCLPKQTGPRPALFESCASDFAGDSEGVPRVGHKKLGLLDSQILDRADAPEIA